MKRYRSTGRLGTLAAISCAVALVGGCNSAPRATTKASPHPRASPTSTAIDSAPAADAQAWRALDVSVIPPRGYAQDIHLTQEVVNRTAGRVTDAVARRWAEDYLRTDQWGLWGTENLQVDGFFNHLAPGDTVTQQALFGQYYGAIDRAQKGHGKIQARNLSVTGFVVAVVPADVKTALVTQFGYPAPIPDYALIVDSHGPAGARIIRPDGSSEQAIEAPATYHERGYVVGEPKVYATTLGEVWFSHTNLGCSINDYLRAACDS